MAAAGIGIFAAKVNAGVAKATVGYKITSATYSAQNAVQAYNYFEQTYQEVQSDESNIALDKTAYKQVNSPMNQTLLLGVEQECNSTVAEYDATVKGLTTAAWLPSNVPNNISLAVCH